MGQAGLQVLAQSRATHNPHATCLRKYRIKFKTAFLNSVTSFQRDSSCARYSLQTNGALTTFPMYLLRFPSPGTESTEPAQHLAHTETPLPALDAEVLALLIYEQKSK